MNDAAAVSEREQTERLARFMRWRVLSINTNGLWWDPTFEQTRTIEGPIAELRRVRGVAGKVWSPFTSASDDYEVLERAREVWLHAGLDGVLWPKFWRDLDAFGGMADYKVGDWSRAVLRVLEERETP